LLVILNVLVLTLALFFIQEGSAQKLHSGVHFFVTFPTKLLPLCYLAALLTLPNLAILFFTTLRRLRKRIWPVVTTVLAVVLVGIVVVKLGPGGVLTVIDPNHQ
jgi:hypothetical protein